MPGHPEKEILESPTALVERLHLPFENLHLLTRALTHRSYMNEHPEALEDNERMEFLGDAVLDFVVGAWLYNRYPEMAEGPLTRMRSALVRTEQLADFARFLNLGPAIRLGHGEEQAGGRDRDVLLCATFEALVGALYLQTDVHVVRRFIQPLLEKTAELAVLQPDKHDPKSRLQEWSQAWGKGIPQYETTRTVGPDHDRLFEVEVRVNGRVIGHGSGHSKQIAARNAARNALEFIDE